MPNITPSQALLIGAFIAPGLLAIIAYLTHAPARRWIGALAGGLAYGALNAGWDRLAYAAGWWRYPAWDASGGLLPFLYIPAGIVCGAIGLIGWRAARRFGWRGLIGFLIIWTLWGMLHDLGGSRLFATSNMMVFGPGFLPALADGALFATGGALVQVVIWLVAGPPHQGRLARTSNAA